MFDVTSYVNGVVTRTARVSSAAAQRANSEVRLANVAAKADPFPVQPHVVNEYLNDAALLVVFDEEGNPACVFDAFILASVNETDQEKSSFLFTFGDAALFGGMDRKPRIYAYSGFLVDSQKDGKCISVWKALYDRYLRATLVADESRYAQIFYRDQWREGYITGCRLAEAADRPQTAILTFNMFVIKEGS